ncbi:hypothetical protein GQ44DRAFT_742841 [Phaeosphaeriaceae sp. PMI808]|nr:hypothetical protein GQ44DRAFT_742841 [Phaeosphaeriaceae sp. PMI808]
MHLKICSLLFAQALSLSVAHPLEARQQQAAGYLATVFKGDVPHVFFNLAPASKPSSFSAVKNGQAILVPTKGTKGARDPFTLRSQDRSKYFVLATDLDIGKTDWGTAQTFGSRSIFVWESSDGITWSKDNLVELMPSTAGYVWAPSAIWDVDRNQYAVFWSSRVYAQADTAHTGPSQGPFIYYSHTSDFKTFTAPALWNPAATATVIDQEIQHIGGRFYVRYLSDTNVVKRVVLDRSDDGLFGTWKRIGVPVDKVREGPASYQDILRPQRYYLWEDDYGGPGYECYWTEDFRVPYTPCSQNLTPGGMRHGAVVQIDQTTFTGLSKL